MQMIIQDNIIHPLISFMSFTPIFTISGQHSFDWSFHLVSFAFSPKNFLSRFYNASVLATSSFSFYLIMSHFIFILEWSFHWLQHSELPIGCFALFFTLKMLFPSLRDSTVFDKKWYVDWIAVLLHVLRHCSLGLYHRLSTLLTFVCRTWRGILCLLCLVFASPICLFSICFFLLFLFLGWEVSFLC